MKNVTRLIIKSAPLVVLLTASLLSAPPVYAATSRVGGCTGQTGNVHIYPYPWMSERVTVSSSDGSSMNKKISTDLGTVNTTSESAQLVCQNYEDLLNADAIHGDYKASKKDLLVSFFRHGETVGILDIHGTLIDVDLYEPLPSFRFNAS